MILLVYLLTYQLFFYQLLLFVAFSIFSLSSMIFSDRSTHFFSIYVAMTAEPFFCYCAISCFFFFFSVLYYDVFNCCLMQKTILVPPISDLKDNCSVLLFMQKWHRWQWIITNLLVVRTFWSILFNFRLMLVQATELSVVSDNSCFNWMQAWALILAKYCLIAGIIVACMYSTAWGIIVVPTA